MMRTHKKSKDVSGKATENIGLMTGYANFVELSEQETDTKVEVHVNSWPTPKAQHHHKFTTKLGQEYAMIFWSTDLLHAGTVESIHNIRAGIDSEFFRSAADHFAISRKSLGCILGMSESTVNRKLKEGQKLDPLASERLTRIASVENEAIDTFGDIDLAKRWLTSMHGVLKVAPLDLLDTEIGANEIRKMLSAIAYGGAV